MTHLKTALWLSSCLCLAAFAAGATEKPGSPATPQEARQAERSAWSSARLAASEAPGKSRIKYRTADGTCACSCATGGISEEEIRKAQEARERPRS